MNVGLGTLPEKVKRGMISVLRVSTNHRHAKTYLNVIMQIVTEHVNQIDRVVARLLVRVPGKEDCNTATDMPKISYTTPNP